jgi:hypothetical protein
VETAASPAKPATGNGPVTLDLKSAQRVEAAVQYVERVQRVKPETRGGLDRGQIWKHKVKVNGTIAAASAASTPRAGSGYICDLVSGVWTPTSQALDIYNPSPGGSVADLSFVTVDWVNGIWEISLDPC